jgi:hypothetical protein
MNNKQIKEIHNLTNKNKIKQSALCCVYCGKSYKTRNNLDKHIILCEITHNVRPHTNNEDDIVLPSPKNMYHLLMELTLKCARLENKVTELSKYVSRKKHKINILDYLNKNAVNNQTILFENITELVTVEQIDIEYLFHNSFIDTLNLILSKNIYKYNDMDFSDKTSIAAFNQKTNTIYIYTKILTNENDKNPGWIIVPRESFIRFLNIIQLKMSKALSEWRKKNNELLFENDSQSVLYDKTFSKLMAPEFKSEAIYKKFYNNIYHKIKKDLNAEIDE